MSEQNTIIGINKYIQTQCKFQRCKINHYHFFCYQYQHTTSTYILIKVLEVLMEVTVLTCFNPHRFFFYCTSFFLFFLPQPCQILVLVFLKARSGVLCVFLLCTLPLHSNRLCILQLTFSKFHNLQQSPAGGCQGIAVKSLGLSEVSEILCK